LEAVVGREALLPLQRLGEEQLQQAREEGVPPVLS
jgi:hypothetical protein